MKNKKEPKKETSQLEIDVNSILQRYGLNLESWKLDEICFELQTVVLKENLPIIIQAGNDLKDGDTFSTVLPNGKRIHIVFPEILFFRQLQDLPATTKIEMMLLTIAEMESFIKDKLSKVKSILIENLNSEWVYRETGDVAQIKDILDYEFNIVTSKDDLIKQIKRNKFPISKLEEINKWFESGNEVTKQN